MIQWHRLDRLETVDVKPAFLFAGFAVVGQVGVNKLSFSRRFEPHRGFVYGDA